MKKTRVSMYIDGRKILSHVRRSGVDPLTCRHEDSIGPMLGTTGEGVVCTECGLLLTWAELAEYMRGEKADD